MDACIYASIHEHSTQIDSNDFEEVSDSLSRNYTSRSTWKDHCHFSRAVSTSVYAGEQIRKGSIHTVEEQDLKRADLKGFSPHRRRAGTQPQGRWCCGKWRTISVREEEEKIFLFELLKGVKNIGMRHKDVAYFWSRRDFSPREKRGWRTRFFSLGYLPWKKKTKNRKENVAKRSAVWR